MNDLNLLKALDMADVLAAKRGSGFVLTSWERERIVSWADLPDWSELEDKVRLEIESKFLASRRKYVLKLYQDTINDLLYLSKALQVAETVCYEAAKNLSDKWSEITDKELKTDIDGTDLEWITEESRSLKKAAE